ncbi:GTP cyclohydrolase I FolE [Halioglobus maricola]|uniref:GTP cyclohydrolase 1 n=1 Tax=Halioglobus maricola TaxID=2601894 RepID=A0A5P9NKG1_9GAMM|nr:GTP cyclohydrolase I FolE [Halioglobus maricola]QFU76353.1 GTP cyclohydrolase I FolE [Halioglobus maricola]
MNAITSPALERAANYSPEALLVREALIEKGLETPLVETGLAPEEQYQRLHVAFTDIMSVLGLDLRDDSLNETPHRIASMYLNDLFEGLDYASFPKITSIENKMGVDEMVLVDNIELISTCEHHFVTIDGFAKIAYIPGERVIGLSKINRLVRFFARRPQVQERLTRQIQVALQTLLATEDVAVVIEATHYCVKSRGVMDTSSSTRTQALGGVFSENENRRREFLG